MSSIKKQETILLEIQVDRANEKGVFVAAQILNVLHDTLEKRSVFPWKNAFKKRPTFSFEIVHIEGRIRFFLQCEKEYQSFVSNQFYAQFPNIDITPVDDYLASTEKVIYTPLRLSSLSYAPLKMYTEFKERTEREVIDPYSAVTSALLKGDTNLEVIQINFTPLHDQDWKRKSIVAVMDSKCPKFVRKLHHISFPWYVDWLLSPVRWLLRSIFIRKKSSEDGDSREQERPTGSAKKMQDFGFRASLAVGQAADSQTNSKLRLKEIVRSLNIYSSPNENGLEAMGIKEDAR